MQLGPSNTVNQLTAFCHWHTRKG